MLRLKSITCKAIHLTHWLWKYCNIFVFVSGHIPFLYCGAIFNPAILPFSTLISADSWRLCWNSVLSFTQWYSADPGSDSGMWVFQSLVISRLVNSPSPYRHTTETLQSPILCVFLYILSVLNPVPWTDVAALISHKPQPTWPWMMGGVVQQQLPNFSAPALFLLASNPYQISFQLIFFILKLNSNPLPWWAGLCT